MSKSLREGASLSRRSVRDRYQSWQRHHRLSAADSLYRIAEAPLSSVLTWLVIGIALALPVGLNVLLENSQQLSANWDSPAQISLFLGDEIDAEAARDLRAELRDLDGVGEVTFVSREDALAEFSALSGFADVVASLDDNPLPNLLLVTPVAGAAAEQIEALLAQLSERPQVARAVLDSAWLARLNSLLVLGQRAVWSLGALLVLGAVLILGNTLRLAIESRREEIVIVKLMGGSNAFVRRPFLYTGLWYGIGGGAMAALLVALGLWVLEAPLGRLLNLYESAFTVQGLGFMGSLNLAMLGGVLGLAGAWLAVSRHLGAIEPR